MRIYTLNVNGFRGTYKGIYHYIGIEELETNLYDFKSLIRETSNI